MLHVVSVPSSSRRVRRLSVLGVILWVLIAVVTFFRIFFSHPLSTIILSRFVPVIISFWSQPLYLTNSSVTLFSVSLDTHRLQRIVFEHFEKNPFSLLQLFSKSRFLVRCLFIPVRAALLSIPRKAVVSLWLLLIIGAIPGVSPIFIPMSKRLTWVLLLRVPGSFFRASRKATVTFCRAILSVTSTHHPESSLRKRPPFALTMVTIDCATSVLARLDVSFL
mmetsp:Transcript_68/g.147  ORF Transcript_68/g.147 Transcript_68/m.147 type:complete len:221 (-) Transcript_68:772-1434(-)